MRNESPLLGYDELLANAGGLSLEVRRLFDLYVHNDIDRRAFLEQAAAFVNQGHEAEELLEALRRHLADNH